MDLPFEVIRRIQHLLDHTKESEFLLRISFLIKLKVSGDMKQSASSHTLLKGKTDRQAQREALSAMLSIGKRVETLE